MPIPPSKGRPMQTITRAQMQIIEIKWEDEKVGGRIWIWGWQWHHGSSSLSVMNTRVCTDTWAFPLSFWATEHFIRMRLLHSEGAGVGLGIAVEKKIILKKQGGRKMVWFTLVHIQTESSPQIKLTTLLVCREWLFLTLCTAGSAGSGNCNNFLSSPS